MLFPCKDPADRRPRGSCPVASDPCRSQPARKPPETRAPSPASARCGESRWGRLEPRSAEKTVIAFSVQVESLPAECTDSSIIGIVSHIIDKKDREQAKLYAGPSLGTLALQNPGPFPCSNEITSVTGPLQSQFRMAARIVFLAHLFQALDRGRRSLPGDSGPGCADSASLLSPHRPQRL